MANIKSQKKRILTNEKARQRNKAVKSSLKTSVRKFNAAAEAGDAEQATNLAREASRKLDKAAYKPCTSPYKVKAKSRPGKGKKHTISIKAKDGAGNVGKPAVVKFKVIRKRK